MKIRIEGTNETVELNIYNDNGIDWVSDFVGNNGGFGRSDEGLIDQDPQDDSQYLATKETIEWWQEVIVNQERTDREIDEYSEKYGTDEIQDYLQSIAAYDTDLEHQYSSIHHALTQYEPS